MTENFSNFVRGKVTQVQEAQRDPFKVSPKRPTPRHIITKMAKLKDKDRILKAARKKELVSYNTTLIKLAANF